MPGEAVLARRKEQVTAVNTETRRDIHPPGLGQEGGSVELYSM
jgi:hypothetical protein